MKKYKFISWNVNGIRAVLKKGFLEYIAAENPDFLAIQESKANKDQVELEIPGYTQYWNSAERKGYSGTVIFAKESALNVVSNLPETALLIDKYGNANNEGRVLTVEFADFYLVNVYTPNSKGDLSRLPLRDKQWDPQFLMYLKSLELSKPVITCGDFNVAHQEIDLARPDTNHFSHGFTDEERQGFTNMVDAGFVDTFRIFNQEGGQYTWWSAFGGARQKNVGWRIDYFLVSASLKERVKSASIQSQVMGSDHCPIILEVEI